MIKNKIELSKEEIIHLSKLAKIQLSDKEIQKYRKQLEETVTYVENLKELNTKNVIPTAHTTDIRNVYFKDGDENTRVFSQKQSLANSSKKKGDYFSVKRIL